MILSKKYFLQKNHQAGEVKGKNTLFPILYFYLIYAWAPCGFVILISAFVFYLRRDQFEHNLLLTGKLIIILKLSGFQVSDVLMFILQYLLYLVAVTAFLRSTECVSLFCSPASHDHDP